MFGRLAAAGSAHVNRRQICRQIVGANFADKACSPVLGACSNGLQVNNHCCAVTHQGTQGTRNFASKAASKFGKKMSKETFDRYLGMDPSRLQHGFEEIPELQDASEDVKRIFSLEFASGKEIKKAHQVDTLEDMGVDPADLGYSNFLVTSIARLTVSIRNLAPHVERFPRDKRNKRFLMIMIDRRRRFISLLRKSHFDLATKLLDKLNLEYTPGPKYRFRQTRRYLEKRSLCQEAFEERSQALEEFTDRLREGQLREIAELKRDLGMELSTEEKDRLAEQ